MMQNEISPVMLTESQIEQGADLLARVFQHDPMMQYMVADSTRMLDKPIRFYQATIRMALQNGEVYTTPTMNGIAVWISPGNTDFGIMQLLKTGLLSATLSMGLKSLGRMMNTANYLEKVRNNAVPEPHWELMLLGVEPSQQGKGIGATLIQPVLAQADAESIPISLESMNERNLTFYERNGFEVVAQGQFPKGGPQFWIMKRKPSS